MRDWCHECEDFGDDTKLVRVVETGSGPGGMLYACKRCRNAERLRPLVDDQAEAKPAARPA